MIESTDGPIDWTMQSRTSEFVVRSLASRYKPRCPPLGSGRSNSQKSGSPGGAWVVCRYDPG